MTLKQAINIIQTHAQQIKESRENAGITGAELSRRIGVSRQLLHQYENEKRQPPYEKLEKIYEHITLIENNKE